MESSDRWLRCKDCGAEFAFSILEQEFFKLKQLANVPKRCQDCRVLNRAQRQGVDSSDFAVVSCATCSKPTRVPFKPKGHKPVLCSACFHVQKRTAAFAETTADSA
jgi:CxxC-x17-CxxC domain-containing protein